LVKYGLNHTVALIEARKASLVVIAHDVDLIELNSDYVCLASYLRFEEPVGNLTNDK
jgi:ribosomal protein L7Ae-like RNA K-turn-binding protein